MTEMEKLKAVLPGVSDTLLTVLLEDAEAAVRRMTGREHVERYPEATRAVAVVLYNRMGREGETAHGSGGVSVSYGELPDAVKHMLPRPLVSVGGRRFEYVEGEP